MTGHVLRFKVQGGGIKRLNSLFKKENILEGEIKKRLLLGGGGVKNLLAPLCLCPPPPLCSPETEHWVTSSERRSVGLSVDYFSLISIYKSPVIQYLHSYLAVIFVGHQWLNLSRGLIDGVRSSLSTLLKLKTNVSAPFMGRSSVKLAWLVIADRSGMF